MPDDPFDDDEFKPLPPIAEGELERLLGMPAPIPAAHPKPVTASKVLLPSNKPVRSPDRLMLDKAYPLGPVPPAAMLNIALKLAWLAEKLRANQAIDAEVSDHLTLALGAMADRLGLREFANEFIVETKWSPKVHEGFLNLCDDAHIAYTRGRKRTTARGYAPYKTGSRFDVLADQLVMLNPTAVPTHEMAAMFGQQGSLFKHNKPPSLDTINVWRQRAKRLYHEQVYDGSAAGLKPGPRSGRSVPLPLLGTQESKTFLHHKLASDGRWDLLNHPLATFHLRSWAKRIYAVRLEDDMQLQECPFTGQSVSWFRYNNDEDNDIRYLIEAYQTLHMLLIRRRDKRQRAVGMTLSYYAPIKESSFAVADLTSDVRLPGMWIKMAHRHHPWVIGGIAGRDYTSADDLGKCIAMEVTRRSELNLSFAKLHTLAGLPGKPVDEKPYVRYMPSDEP